MTEQPPKPVYQQFGERSGNALSGSAVMSPVVVNLLGLMEQARQTVERRGFTEFYPPFWMYDKLLEVAAEYSPAWRERVKSESFQRFAQKVGINTDNINTRDEISDEGLEERQQFFGDLATAYGIAAYSRFTPRQKDRFRQYLRELNIGSVTLSERQREVLGYITTATETPFNSNQTEYEFATVLTQPEITEREMEDDPRYNTW